MTLYDDLGVPKNADRATIKRAYRKRAQTVHPDKGGSADAFDTVRLAYNILKDESKRAAYDADGSFTERDHESEILQGLAQLFLQALNTNDPEHTDLIGVVKLSIQDAQRQRHAKIKMNNKGIATMEATKTRIEKKSGGENFFSAVLDGHITAARRQTEMIQMELQRADRMIKILDDYKYKHERPITRPGFQILHPFTS